MKSFAIPTVLVLLVGTVVALTSCVEDESVYCSAEVVSIEFRVVDSSGNPVDSLTITVTNARTDDIYDVDQPNYEVGLYRALSDRFKGEIRSYGEPILVHGARGNLEFDAVFLIGVDDDGCHIEKLVGPEVVVMVDP